MSSLSRTLYTSGHRSLLSTSRRSRALVGSSKPSVAVATAAAPPAVATFTSRSFNRLSFSGVTPFLLSSSSRSLLAHNNGGQLWTSAGCQQHPVGGPIPSSNSSGIQRSMMSKAGKGGKKSSAGKEGQAGKGKEEEEEEEEEEEQEQDDPGYKQQEEPVNKVKLVGGAILLTLFVASVSATMIELMPSHTAPQSIMSRAHDILQADPDTANHYGTPLKVYGRDSNRHREGRRNFVEHADYTDETDESKRTRVRFNVEGPNGHGMAYAEVSSKMESGEWVYLCVQDMETGHVITLHDNRALLLTQNLASSNEEKSALRKMLGQ